MLRGTDENQLKDMKGKAASLHLPYFLVEDAGRTQVRHQTHNMLDTFSHANKILK